ncbi:exonuclease SbcCD subunit D [Oceanobacillus sp. FSL H7-0719]|uniref:exonuclease SbcCD subunit D n=1 Tax=Oceanobacillus sp. FSL H7-0719 TaxID=2954507 RepID=UPI0032479A63
MKIFHTADWHLGKLVQGVYMTEDQSYILDEFIKAVEEEKPDAIVIAGDLYDRAVPPTEAVQLLDDVLGKIVIDLQIPVIAIAGNHDSPGRLHFGSNLMKRNGFHIAGKIMDNIEPVILKDTFGEVHFHLIPYCDPSIVRNVYKEESIRNHNDAQRKILEQINAAMDPKARHIGVGHAFVTPYGEEEENTSDSERPLSIGGSEYVDAHHYMKFDYMALGHLHQAHYVLDEKIRYAGSLLKYSISEEHHKKGFFIVEIDGTGKVEVEKRLLTPRRDMRTVEGYMEDILKQPVNEDYVFVKLLDETPVLSPMEKVRSVYPNAMHVERKFYSPLHIADHREGTKERRKMTDIELFRSFYEEVKGDAPSEQANAIFAEALEAITNETK